MKKLLIISAIIVFTILVFNVSCKNNSTSSVNTVPTASFTISPTSGTVDTVFDFDASSSTDNEDATSALQVRWDWNNDGVWDSEYRTIKTIIHQFLQPGTYTIVLEVKDTGGLTNTYTKTVSVGQSNTTPTASFTVNPTSGTTATTFNFDASGSSDNEDAISALEVRWDWENDGTWDTNYSTTKTANHQYVVVGSYTAKCEVRDSGGLTDTTTKTVNVSNTEPTASFTIDPTSGTTLTTFTFDASGSSDNEDATSALQVRWDWTNDGSYDTNWSADKTTNHQYSAEGTKTIKLEVKDTGGLTNTTTKQVTVSNGGGGGTGTVTDIDGNVYNTVTIGNQVWMAENLKVTRYRNGDTIPNVTDDSEWANLNTGAYCSYANNDNYVSTYGRLYNWFAVDDPRGLAPDGWHVPTDDEWKQLEMNLGMSQSEADNTGWRGTDEGGKLKEAGTTHWYSPNTGATNSSGFTALSGGYRFTNGAFTNMGDYAFFWSSTENNSNNAWDRILIYYYSDVARNNNNKQKGFSVRCVRD